MAKLLKLKSGSSFDPSLVAGIVKFAKKGVVIRNEYNKIIVFEPEIDAERQNVIDRCHDQLLFHNEAGGCRPSQE